MKTQLTTILCAMSLLAGAQSLVAAADMPSPADITISKITVGGAGCPQGTDPSAVFDNGGKVIVVKTPVFAAKSGGPLSEQRVQCRIGLDLQYPAGFEIAIDKVEFDYTPELGDGATAEIQTMYYFQGGASDAKATKEVTSGDSKGKGKSSSGSATLGEIWSGCGAKRALNLGFAVRIKKAGSAAADKLTFETPATLSVKWRRCAK
jgi:Domain of unknown function (DUF4360)